MMPLIGTENGQQLMHQKRLSLDIQMHTGIGSIGALRAQLSRLGHVSPSKLQFPLKF